MGDFIKELNIIDFLGMMLPGSVMILLFSNESVNSQFWTYFGGTGPSEATRSVFLIVGGYVVGMLLHEIGELLENGLWKCMYLNPRLFAALTVGGEKAKGAFEALHLPGNTQAERFRYENRNKQLSFRGFLFFTALLTVLVLLHGVFLFPSSIGYNVLNMVLYPSLIYCQCYYAYRHFHEHDAHTQGNEPNYFLCLVLKNDDVQIKLSNDGNYKKRVLFDGFRVMMRNMILILHLIRIDMLYLGGTPLGDIADIKHFSVYFFIVLGLMRLRYWHYACLKYKYCYEELYLETQTGQPDKPAGSPTNHPQKVPAAAR